MKKSLFYAFFAMVLTVVGAHAQVTPQSQMERLDRGVVVSATSIVQHFVSWRLLGTDDKAATTFDVVRDGQTIATDLSVTNFRATGGSATSKYQIVTKVNGEVTETSEPVMPWAGKFMTLNLSRPAGGIHKSWDGGTNVPYSYYPNDMSVGDVDGDGQYELFLKWESTHAQDNSYSKGYTGNTYIDCYKVFYDGSEEMVNDQPANCKLLWRIDLGQNIRDGAHYTQFMVYDFDGDGRAEMICKTATGSKDGTGAYVNQAATDATIKGHANDKDYRNSNGHILSGPEYLTVFEGATGKALHTTWYLPGRAGTGKTLPSGKAATEGGSELGKVSAFPSGFWGDNYGGRSERFLGAVAYINGADKPACAVFSRGYYTQAYVWAVSFDGTRLHTEWLHASPSPTQSLVFTSKFEEGQTGVQITVDGDVLLRTPLKTAPANTSGVTAEDAMADEKGNRGITGSNTLYANGNHNLSVADVDGDGCDEILWGSAALDHDGMLLYATGYGHGDAIHVGKMIPDSADLYVFDVHEEKLNSNHGSWDVHNARTGRIIWHGGSAGADNGRGMAADLYPSKYRGYQFWSSDERKPKSAATGKEVISKSCSVNFRIYWDGSYQDQLFDGSYQYDGDVWAQTAHAEPFIQKYTGSGFDNVNSFYTSAYNNAQTANYTKATPCLQADIVGDWREELILWNKKDSAQVMLFTTWTPTKHAVPTLMHDHVYRMGIAWQNTAYNQPPHLGYYLPDYIEGKLPNSVSSVAMPSQQTRQIFDLQGRRLPASSLESLPKGFYIIREGNRTLKIKN